MKRHLKIAAAFFAVAAVHPAAAQTVVTPSPLPAQQPATLVDATQFDVASAISGRTYRAYVYKPLMPPPPEGYPLIYVTDGNGMFGTAAMQMMLRQFGELRPAIIVGVGYPVSDIRQIMALRNADLTPPTPAENIPPALKAMAGKDGRFGGAELFYRFMVEELRPMLAAAYPVDLKDQTLLGDSLGGLFTLHVLFNHPESFRTFVAASPSIWWNRRAVLNEEAAFRTRVAAGKAAPRVLITVGALEQKPGESVEDASGMGRMVDNASELAARLAAVSGSAGYEVRFVNFPEETHSSVIPAAVSRGVGFALAGSK